MTFGDRQVEELGCVEVETQPEQLFHLARDWGELLMTRQLAEPLFLETPDRGISSRLFESVQRSDAHTWRLRVGGDVRWSNGAQVTARQICQQLRHVSRSSALGARYVAFVKELRVSDEEIQLRTSIPIGDIRRLLTSPALGPATSVGIFSGSFTLHARLPTRLILRRVNKGYAIAATKFQNHRSLRMAAEVGTLDATSLFTGGFIPRGGVGVHYTHSAGDLDIVMALQIPPAASRGLARLLAQAIDRTALASAVPDLLRPLATVTGTWCTEAPVYSERMSSERTTEGDVVNEESLLQYTDFYPNRIVAEVLAVQLRRELGMRLRPTAVPYEQYLKNRYESAAQDFRLILVAPSWTHPSAFLIPMYLQRRRVQTSATEFDRYCACSLSADSLRDATRYAVIAEGVLNSVEKDFIPLAQLRADLAHRGESLWIPPSGLIDFTMLGVDGLMSGDSP